MKHHTKRPPVHGRPVLSGEDLGSDVSVGADKRAELTDLPWMADVRHAKVAENTPAVARDEYILDFDVAVDNAKPMQGGNGATLFTLLRAGR